MTRKTVSTLFLLLALAAAVGCTGGCAGGRAAAASAGVWTLAVGQAEALPEGGSIVLDKVDDSRCPAGVVCVWEGDATAHLTLRGGAAPEETVVLSLRAQSAGAARGLELRLVAVEPAPREGVEIDPGSYRATVEWRRP